jgi:glycosyltransferase involved in cell wall biosynthesis
MSKILDNTAAISSFPGPNTSVGASKNLLPTISFVVTNYNYGEFLNRCVQSIFAQSYKKIECVIVDDASSDNSTEVIRAIEAPEHVTLAKVFNNENLGQAASCALGFKHTVGEYVAFIDADDELYPDYALAHIRTHLTIRRPVGFSSSDMTVVVDSRVVASTMFVEDCFERLTEKVEESEFLSISPAIAPFFVDLPNFSLRYVDRKAIKWPWAPTSGNVYRRDALSLFVENDELTELEYSADAYFNFGINSLCGSVLIDRAFSMYHIHRRNYFAQSALLHGIRSFDARRDFGTDAAYLALRHIIRHFEFFAWKVALIGDLNRALSTLTRKAAQSTKLSKLGLALLVKVLASRWRFQMRGLGRLNSRPSFSAKKVAPRDQENSRKSEKSP